MEWWGRNQTVGVSSERDVSKCGQWKGLHIRFCFLGFHEVLCTIILNRWKNG